jgi:hypothetical protein
MVSSLFIHVYASIGGKESIHQWAKAQCHIRWRRKENHSRTGQSSMSVSVQRQPHATERSL